MRDERVFLKTVLVFLVFVAGVLNTNPARCSEKPVAGEPTVQDVAAVIETLEDTAARGRLVQQLKIIVQAQQEEVAGNEVKTAANQLLKEISSYLNQASSAFTVFANSLYEVPRLALWMKGQLVGPETRTVWLEILFNLFLTLSFGYFVYYFIRVAAGRFQRKIQQRDVTDWFSRFIGLLTVGILDVLPVVGFAVATYSCLSAIGPRENTRLVALAWVNAFILAQIIAATLNFLLSPRAAGLRLFRIADPGSVYLSKWAKRLTHALVYGYFSLQAALLLGLPAASYGVLLRLLGLFATTHFVVVILQQREVVAGYIQHFSISRKQDSVNNSEEGETIRPESVAHGLRSRLARLWHLLALFYVVLLYSVWALQVPGGFIYLLRATVLSLITLAATKWLLGFPHVLLLRTVAIVESMTIFPGLAVRLKGYVKIVCKILRGMMYVAGGATVLQCWGINAYSWLSSSSGKILVGMLLSVSGIIFVTLLVWEIANSLIEKSLSRKDSDGNDLEASARTRTLLTVARKALAIAMGVISGLMVLSELGVDIAPLLASAGVLGLAVGFGAQKLVQDVITGVFILLEDQIAVGDVVDLGGIGGVVEGVSIRTVRLRDVAGTVHTIPYSSINTVSNKTRDFSFYVMEIGIAYRENVDEVMNLLRELSSELKQDAEYGPKMIEPIDILGLDSFGDSAVIIKARLKTVPGKQWWVGREFNKRMKAVFDEKNIEIPFPHQTIYFGADRAGEAPAAKVEILSGERSQV
ncbi:MAG: mechanosensitive ion channel [Desulfuromonadaceae bacterium]|nr:mechanosensitive ion channel [Desulfuromonadaceae bacterium]